MKRVQSENTHTYVSSMLSNPSIMKILEHWSIEYKFIAQVVTDHLFSLGVYQVDPVVHKGLVLNTIRTQLIHNQTIQNRLIELKKLQEESSARKRRDNT